MVCFSWFLDIGIYVYLYIYAYAIVQSHGNTENHFQKSSIIHPFIGLTISWWYFWFLYSFLSSYLRAHMSGVNSFVQIAILKHTEALSAGLWPFSCLYEIQMTHQMLDSTWETYGVRKMSGETWLEKRSWRIYLRDALSFYLHSHYPSFTS